MNNLPIKRNGMLETTLCGLRMKNPFVLASGVRGNSASLLIRAAREGAGAVTSKSCSLLPREGHANPTMVEKDGVLLNAIGLSNPGVDEEIGEIRAAIKGAGVPVIASIVAFSVADFGRLAERISAAKPPMIEVDASCPNIEKGGKMFSCYVKDAAAVAKEVRAATKIPFSIKLSPDVPNIGEIAKACVDAGADCITAVNTVGGMYIDPYARRAVLHNWFGGVSGPAIKPVALKAVYNVRKAVGPKVPIIGTGGVSTGLDAVEMLMAGATAVGIGSAVISRSSVFSDACAEMRAFMRQNGYSKLSSLRLEE